MLEASRSVLIVDSHCQRASMGNSRLKREECRRAEFFMLAENHARLCLNAVGDAQKVLVIVAHLLSLNGTRATFEGRPFAHRDAISSYNQGRFLLSVSTKRPVLYTTGELICTPRSSLPNWPNLSFTRL